MKAVDSSTLYILFRQRSGLIPVLDLACFWWFACLPIELSTFYRAVSGAMLLFSLLQRSPWEDSIAMEFPPKTSL